MIGEVSCLWERLADVCWSYDLELATAARPEGRSTEAPGEDGYDRRMERIAIAWGAAVDGGGLRLMAAMNGEHCKRLDIRAKDSRLMTHQSDCCGRTRGR